MAIPPSHNMLQRALQNAFQNQQQALAQQASQLAAWRANRMAQNATSMHYYGNQQRSSAPVYIPDCDAAPRPPVRDDGIVIGETVAWRCWRVTRQTYLASMAMDVIWGSDEPMDGKIVCDHGQADSGGVHAFKSQREALSYAGVRPVNQSLHAQTLAVGRVKLFGRIVEHEEGYRAEYARVAEITDVFGDFKQPEEGRLKLIAVLNKRYCTKLPKPPSDG